MSSGESLNNGDQEPALQTFIHTDRETGETFVSPFPVAVFGVNKEFFGVGQVIGGVNKYDPVIEVLDRDDGRPYRVMGYESWWTCPVPEEIIDQMVSGELAIDSVAIYKQALDDSWKTTEIADNEFLHENGINPDLDD